MATEHPGMGPYRPDPGEEGDSHREDPERTERRNLPGSRSTEPTPALPMPGVPNPTAAMPGPGESDPAATAPHLGPYPPPPPLSSGPPHGRIERQEPGVTQARPPTVAEARARDKARKRAEEAERAAALATEAAQRRRRRTLIGGAAIVGVAAVIGAGYLAYEAAEPDVTAYCTTDDNGQQTVVDDNDCVRAENYATSTGAYHSGLPAVFFFNGHQYRYYYGGSNAIGRTPVGGSFTAPSNAHVSTKSGTVIRGGLGSKNGGRSGGS